MEGALVRELGRQMKSRRCRKLKNDKKIKRKGDPTENPFLVSPFSMCFFLFFSRSETAVLSSI